jgi:integrase
MGTVSFYLHRGESKSEECLIFLSFHYDKKRLRVSTGEKVNPKHWNADEYRVRKTHKEAESINHALDKIAGDYRKAYRTLKAENKKITNEALKIQIDKTNNKVRSNRTLFGFISEFIEKAEGRVKHGTIKSYKTTEAVLNRFKLHKRKGFDFDDIDMNFYDDFFNFLTKELEYSANTVGKHIKNLKVFMNEANQRGVSNNLEFLKKGFKVPKEDIDNVYLSEDEIMDLYQLDLSGKLAYARDLFIVGCYTGLRFSDFSQIKRENIRNDMISLRTQKTGELVSIPVHPLIKEIMMKYKGKFANSLPPAFANQVMNGYLKKIGEMAGLTEPFIISKTIAGKKEERTFKKYEIITTHTARRSFATNLFLQEFPAISIMKITGHRSEKNFMNYIKLTPHQNAEKLRKHWQNIQSEKVAQAIKRKNARLEIVA